MRKGGNIDIDVIKNDKYLRLLPEIVLRKNFEVNLITIDEIENQLNEIKKKLR